MDTVKEKKQPTIYSFPGYVSNKNLKPPIIELISVNSKKLFRVALTILFVLSIKEFITEFVHPYVLFAAIGVLFSLALYPFLQIRKTINKLKEENENIYGSMLTCYLLKRMNQVVDSPGSTWLLVESFERENSFIKTKLKDTSNTLITIFRRHLKKTLRDILVSEHKEDKVKILNNVSEMRSFQNLGHPTDGSAVVQDIVCSVFREFATEEYDGQWIGFYRANKNNIQIKRLLYKIFDSGSNKIKRLEALEKA